MMSPMLSAAHNSDQWELNGKTSYNSRSHSDSYFYLNDDACKDMIKWKNTFCTFSTLRYKTDSEKERACRSSQSDDDMTIVKTMPC